MNRRIFARANTDTMKQTLQIFWRENKSERKNLWKSLLSITSQNLLYIIILPLLMSFFTQSVIAHPHELTTPLLLIGAMVVVSLLSVIAGHIGFITLFNHEEFMTSRLLNYALRGLLAHSHSFFANSKVGALSGDATSFSRAYMQLFDTFFLQANVVIVNIIFSLIVVAFIAPAMLPVLIVLTILVIIVSIRSYQRRAPLRAKRKEMHSQLTGQLADTLGNQTLVRMFSRSRYEADIVQDARVSIENVAHKEIAIIQANAEHIMAIVFGFQVTILLLCLWLLHNNLLSIAALVFIITYLGRISSSMFSIGSIFRSAEQAFLDSAKITEILAKTPDVLDAPNAKELKAKRGDIALVDVNFAYSDATDKPVFHNLNLHIPAGQSLGLVGKSGGGKSSLTSLLLRYMDIESGQIMIDGQNIANVTQDSLRGAISYVPQDPYLFHRSLRENIAYGKPDATDAEILDAAKKANATEFIDTLPNGLDTIVGERGVKFSGGQRQRIAIARAILKDAPLLILDEATSALDSESEKLIQESLESLMKNRTSIVIAHRLSTIAKLDRIIVLNNGAIVEDGTHSELRKANGVYASLWHHQSGGFIEE